MVGYNNILRNLKSQNIKEREIIGFDVETTGKTNQFYMGGLATKKGFISFYDREELIHHLLNTKSYYGNVYITATNLGFDFNAVFFGTRFWNDFHLIMRGGDMVSATYTNSKTKQKITFIDTLNFAKFSVKIMGEILQKAKIKSPKCLGRLPLNDEEREELERYNQRDCEITREFMIFLQQGFTKFGGKTKLTVASTAMDIYRRRYLKRWIFKEDHMLQRSQKNTIHDFIFKSYYGGRTEVFKRGLVSKKTIGGSGKLYGYDINSLYPSVMVRHYPKPSSVKHTITPNPKLLSFQGVSKVNISAPLLDYPILPFRSDDGKLLFPTGTFEGVYTHEELNTALKHGYKINKMFETVYYTRSFYPFKEYINDMYKARNKYKAEKNPTEIVTKLLMNSLYGKFGQKGVTDTKIIDFQNLSPEETNDFKVTSDMYTRDGRFILQTVKKDSYKSFVIPIFASYTTSMARLELYKYLQPYDAFYCDTDSVFTLKEMPTSNELGDMKLEYDIENAILVKPKMYYFQTTTKEVVRLKGVSKMDREKFFKALNKENIGFIKFSKLKESVRRGFLPNTIFEMEKTISLEDTKRNWSKGFCHESLQTSIPIHLTEENGIKNTTTDLPNIEQTI